MSLGVFLAVLGAAFLHAAWNGLIRLGGNPLGTMLIMTLTQGLVGLAVAVLRPWPATDVWPWLVASGALHSAYKFLLIFAYEHGDLSRVYPIARGAAPAIVLVASLLILAEPMTGGEILGIAVLIAGILTMAQGVFAAGESARLLPFALGSALATAGYSIVDGVGARISGDAVMYVAWLFVFDAVFFTPVCLGLRGRSVWVPPGRAWAPGVAAALGSYAAYAIAVWAMTRAPIALVTALRETSILFAVLIGWLVFREPMGRGKALAAGLILAGVVLTRL
ncbi:MAG: EamA family transporter [Rhodobacter sp.]|nr:EamA family transporter [Rhodobacter sp.]